MWIFHDISYYIFDCFDIEVIRQTMKQLFSLALTPCQKETWAVDVDREKCEAVELQYPTFDGNSCGHIL